jgi:hypothetical protein
MSNTGEHFQTADLLYYNGADPDIWGQSERNPLHAAAFSGNFEVLRILIECEKGHQSSLCERSYVNHLTPLSDKRAKPAIAKK